MAEAKPETDSSVPLTTCYCTSDEKSRELAEKGHGHVHCVCDKCNGEAVYYMTAWRHMQKQGILNSMELDSSVMEYNNFYHSQTSCSNVVCNFAGNEQYLNHNNEDGVDLEQEEMLLENADLLEGNIEDEEMNRGDNDYDGDIENNNVREFVRDAVLKLVELKGETGISHKHFEQMLHWGKDLHCAGNANQEPAQYWPNTWEEVKLFLEEIGYKDAKLFWICLNANHPCVYGLMNTKEEVCPHCGQQGKIPYYYLSLIDKVKRWCSSAEMCRKMISHWQQREHWITDEAKVQWGWHNKSEIWDGRRFAELSYFWDPNKEWVLPCRCPHGGCSQVISSDELCYSQPVEGQQDTFNVVCPSCLNMFEHTLKKVNGDPRNIAYDGECFVIKNLV